MGRRVDRLYRVRSVDFDEDPTPLIVIAFILVVLTWPIAFGWKVWNRHQTKARERIIAVRLRKYDALAVRWPRIEWGTGIERYGDLRRLHRVTEELPS